MNFKRLVDKVARGRTAKNGKWIELSDGVKLSKEFMMAWSEMVGNGRIELEYFKNYAEDVIKQAHLEARLVVQDLKKNGIEMKYKEQDTLDYVFVYAEGQSVMVKAYCSFTLFDRNQSDKARSILMGYVK